jgi:hypothetical protein
MLGSEWTGLRRRLEEIAVVDFPLGVTCSLKSIAEIGGES